MIEIGIIQARGRAGQSSCSPNTILFLDVSLGDFIYYGQCDPKIGIPMKQLDSHCFLPNHPIAQIKFLAKDMFHDRCPKKALKCMIWMIRLWLLETALPDAAIWEFLSSQEVKQIQILRTPDPERWVIGIWPAQQIQIKKVAMPGEIDQTDPTHMLG